MVSAWITHVKDYAKKHDVSYKDAMSKAKASYKKGSPSKTKKGDKDFTAKKGTASKTKKGDKDFTTKKGSKDFHEDGKDVKKKKKPFTN